MAKWICSNDSSHTFSNPTSNLFCDKCPPYSGVLMEYDGIIITPPEDEGGNGVSVIREKHGVGLYIFLVDASGSMFSENAFPNVTMSRAKLVSSQIAGAIFNMEDMTKKDDAYLFVLLFDHNLKPFINFMNVTQVFAKYENAEHLEQALYKEMEKMQGATDINLALKTAYHHAQKFVDGEMDVLGKITPYYQQILNPITGDDITMPNVRCLIFTDGDQYTPGTGTNKLEENPFKEFTYNNEKVNVLMGAYHGNGTDNGCTQLKSIMGNCFTHQNEPQFFLFDDAKKIGNMYKLFRMASGPSGFCPKCLENLTISDRKNN